MQTGVTGAAIEGGKPLQQKWWRKLTRMRRKNSRTQKSEGWENSRSNPHPVQGSDQRPSKPNLVRLPGVHRRSRQRQTMRPHSAERPRSLRGREQTHARCPVQVVEQLPTNPEIPSRGTRSGETLAIGAKGAGTRTARGHGDDGRARTNPPSCKHSTALLAAAVQRSRTPLDDGGKDCARKLQPRNAVDHVPNEVRNVANLAGHGGTRRTLRTGTSNGRQRKTIRHAPNPLRPHQSEHAPQGTPERAGQRRHHTATHAARSAPHHSGQGVRGDARSPGRASRPRAPQPLATLYYLDHRNTPVAVENLELAKLNPHTEVLQ
jgi:hypothetical protein